MNGWQINTNGKIEKISRTEMLNSVDSLKVKITRALITEEDIALISGEGKAATFPLIPGRMAIGQITDLASPSEYLAKGAKVCISAARSCGNCYHCLDGKDKQCFDFKIAGVNADGFLKDFAVLTTEDVFPLPPSVKETDAIYLEYIALALSVIDKLHIEKGQHVAIIGATVFGCILSQLIIYYQGVPILIDDEEEGLLTAKKSGIYYTLKVTPKIEVDVGALTGGRMISKVVFSSRANSPVDLAFKIASPFAEIAFAGFSYPSIKAPLQIALKKQLTCKAITNGFGNYETAINVLANKAVDLSHYALPLTKMEDIETNVDNMRAAFKEKKKFSDLLINMLG